MDNYKSELELQQKIFLWFYKEFPEFRIINKSKKIRTPRCLLIHNYLNPRNKIDGARLAGCGLTKGFPDLSLFVPRGTHGALIIELKVGNEKPKPEQNEVIEALKKQGYAVTWTNNLEDAQKIIKSYLTHGKI